MGNSSTGSQVPGFTSPMIGNVPSLLNVSPMQTGPSYVVPGNTLKDGNRYILKIADLDSFIGSWLAAYAGRLITVYLPQYNIAWSGYSSIRRTEHPYLYIRYPKQLKRLAEELWRIGTIPVVVIIPTLPIVQGNLKNGIKPVKLQGGDAPSHPGSVNRGAPGDRAVRSPSGQER